MSEYRPRVSICIPVYNQRGAFLRACLQSALNQTYRTLEIVVSDNHSTNETPEILAEFTDPRLKVVKPPAHLIMSAHFAFAAQQCTGDYLCFLPSDDLLQPDCCERLVSVLMSHPQASFGFGAWRYIDIQGDTQFAPHTTNRIYIRDGRQELQKFIVGNQDWILGALIRRDIYEQVGGINTDLVYGFDWHLALRLLTVGQVIWYDAIVASVRTWYSPERATRFISIGSVRDYRLIFDFLGSPDFIGYVVGGSATVARARRAVAFAISRALLRVGHRLPRAELEAVICELQLIDQSRRSKLMLWLVQTPFARPLGLLSALIYKGQVMCVQLLDRFQLRTMHR